MLNCFTLMSGGTRASKMVLVLRSTLWGTQVPPRLYEPKHLFPRKPLHLDCRCAFIPSTAGLRGWGGNGVARKMEALFVKSPLLPTLVTSLLRASRRTACLPRLAP